MLKKISFLVIFGILCNLGANSLTRSPQSLAFETKQKQNQAKSQQKQTLLKQKSAKKDKYLKDKRKQIDKDGFDRIYKYNTSKKLYSYPPKS